MMNAERAYEAHERTELDLTSEIDSELLRLEMDNFSREQRRVMRDLPELNAAREALRALRAAANRVIRKERRDWEREGDRLYAAMEAEMAAAGETEEAATAAA